MKFKYFGLWADEEHGLVIIRKPNLPTRHMITKEIYRERYLIYDFDRLEVYSYLRGSRKCVFKESPKYNSIKDITPALWRVDTLISKEQQLTNEAKVITDTLVDMYNKLLNNLFPISTKVLEEVRYKSRNEPYQGLELMLKLMWYLVKYPQVSYLLRDMPQMTVKFLRISYNNCFSKSNWSPEQVFDLSQIQPHKMLYLPRSLYLNNLRSKTNTLKNMARISARVGPDYLLKTLEWPDSSITGLTDLIENYNFFNDPEFIRKLINHGPVTADYVKNYAFEIRDHCHFTNTDITKLSLKMSNLRYIIRNHNRIARRMAEIAREERRKEHEKKLSLLRSLSPHLSRKVDDYTFVLLTDIKDFKKEGKVMNNCVAGYSNGEYAILSMRKDNKSIVDIQYDLTKRKILQKFQSHNRPCTAEQNKVISKWLREVKKASKSMKQTTEKEIEVRL